MSPDDRLVVVIDTANLVIAMDRINMMLPYVNTFKLGHIIYSSPHFWSVVEYLKIKDKKVFLDLKLWDIPKTLIYTIPNFYLRIDFFTMKWDALPADTVKAMQQYATPLAVVHLSSDGDVSKLSDEWDSMLRVNYNGFDHAIVSPKTLRMFHLIKLTKWVPGIRLEEQTLGGHADTITPKEAFKLGADKIILGEALFTSADPVHEILKICHNYRKSDDETKQISS